jgi:integrase
MVYSFGRISAVLGMNASDYYMNGNKSFLRLHEKGGKFHEVVAHHKLIEYLDEYIRTAGLSNEKKTPLFRTAPRNGKTLSKNRLQRTEALLMIKRRCLEAHLPETICCHTFRATGITTYLKNGGTVEKAQQIAAHESPRTTKLYDRNTDEVSLDETEKIII